MSELVVRKDLSVVSAGTQDFVTIMLAGQLLGIPVLAVHDVLNAQKITKIPLAPSWVAGVLNLRNRLGLEPLEDGKKSMSVVVEHRGEPYSLQIDSVGEVLSLDDQLFEKSPVTLDPVWREVSKGIYRLDNELMAVLDVDKLLEIETSNGAAA